MAPRHPHPTVPVALTRFVGRAREIDEVSGLLARRRLLTLTGVGGCGKTRLATRLVDPVGPDRELAWLDVGAVPDADQLPRFLAGTTGELLDPAADPLAALVRHLRERDLLLCLDTCESHLEAIASVVERLLVDCPALAVLATSREPLGVAGETVWQVPPMVEDDSLELFEDRAELVAPTLDLGAHRADSRRACREVDGIPLAVELAAAWVRVLTPAQIADGLADSLRLLSGGSRSVDTRHRTLRASLDWSHVRLTPSEQRLFRRLSVLAGSFSLAAAQAVSDEDEDVLPTLGHLVDKSLLAVEADPEGKARYRLLDVVRQYATERLTEAGENGRTRECHLDHFLAFAERAEIGLELDQDTWRNALDREQENVTAALESGLWSSHGYHRARRLAAAMSRYWFVCGRAHEGLDVLDRALELTPANRSELQGRLHCGRAMLGMVAGRRDLSAEAARIGLEISTEAGDDRTRARCLLMLSYEQFFVDFQACQDLGATAHELGEAAGDSFARDWGAVLAAYSLLTRDRHAESTAISRPTFERSLPRGDRFCAGFALGPEMFAALYCGDVPAAARAGERMSELVAPVGDYFAVGTLAALTAFAWGMAGDVERGRELLRPVVSSVDEVPDVDVIGLTVSCGALALWSGDLVEAVRWYEQGVHDPRRRDAWTAARCLPGLATALRRLGRTEEARVRADEAVRATRAFGAPSLLAAALDEQAVLRSQEDPAEAVELLHEALGIRRDAGLRTVFVDSLDALAGPAAATERYAEAARLIGSSDSARLRMGYPRPAVALAEHGALVDRLDAELDDYETLHGEGADLSLDQAIAGVTRGRGPRDRPATGWGSLTPAELGVVRLVRGGLSNPEIGARLFISRATVKTHLSHVYAKVGVTNRTGLASLAAERLGEDQ